MKFTGLAIIILLILSCKDSSSGLNAQTKNSKSDIGTVEKSEDQWKSELNELEYHVLRQEGTESAFTGEFWDHKEDGVYTCGGCGLPVFDSKTKFKSGTGWPSYTKPVDESHVGTTHEVKFGFPRTEVHCARCDSHLGHVFKDGPEPTGLRYCINSVSLDFEERK